MDAPFEREIKRARISENLSEYAARNNFEIVDPSYFDAISDVEASLSLILGRVPDQNIYPRMVFKHQLYSIIKNRTEIETEIEILTKHNRIRAFLIPGGRSHVGLMFSKDYGADILNCAETLESCGDTQGAAALHLFKEWTTHHNSFLVFESELTGHDPDNQRSPLYEQKDSSQLQLKGPVLTPQDVQVVVENGFLIMKRDTKAVGTYCVSHPKMGELLSAVDHMSIEIVKAVKKSQYKEIPEKSLVGVPGRPPKGANGFVRGKRKVPKDGWVGLGWKYHIYEMTGRGCLLRIDENLPEVVLRLPTASAACR